MEIAEQTQIIQKARGWVRSTAHYSQVVSNLIHAALLMTKLHIFSSHRWAYGEHRDGLHHLLHPWTKSIDFVDLSVAADHPIHAYGNRALARELVNRIRRADVFLAMAGMYANHSDWMRREIDWAFAHEKYIIPVIPHQQERVAGTATDFGSCAPVHWRGDSIKAAILHGLGPERAGSFLRAMHARKQAPRRTILAGALGPAPASLPEFLPRRTIMGSDWPPK